MSDALDKMKMMSEALRSRTKSNPDNPKLKPLEKRARGYQIYRKEMEVEGSDPLPYEEWIKSQE